MEVDLRELENKLTSILEELDVKEEKLREELRAIELVKQASEAEQTTAPGISNREGPSRGSTSDHPEVPSPAGLSATIEAPSWIQEGELPQEEPAQRQASAGRTASQETSVEPAQELVEIPPAMGMSPPAATAPPSEPAPEPEFAPEPPLPEEEAPSLKVLVSGATPEDAVLAVLKSWNTRLKSAKIAEELIAAGYSFPSGNPRDLVTDMLHDMARDSKIKKVKTIKGTYFTLLQSGEIAGE